MSIMEIQLNYTGKITKNKFFLYEIWMGTPVKLFLFSLCISRVLVKGILISVHWPRYHSSLF